MEGESTSQAPHLDIPISDPPEPSVAPLAVNGMTLDEVWKIQDTMQLARQLEAKATLQGHQRLIERTAEATSSSEKGESKLDEHLPVDTQTFETDNWKYSVLTQTLFNKLTQQYYHISWAELRATVTTVNIYDEFKEMLSDTLNQIITLKSSKINFNYPAEGPIPYVGTVNACGPTLQDFETPATKSREDPSMAISPENSVEIQGERVSMTPLTRSVPQSFEPFESIPLTSISPNISIPNIAPSTSQVLSAPFLVPTYTFMVPPPSTIGFGYPASFPMPIPWSTPRPTPLTSIPPITPSFPFFGLLPRLEPIPPPGIPPIAPHHVPMARPLAAVGFPYYPPPTVVAPVDPITVVAAVGQAMAEQMAPRARDTNRNGSR